MNLVGALHFLGIYVHTNDTLNIIGHRAVQIHQLWVAVGDDAAYWVYSKEKRTTTKKWLYETAIFLRHFREDFTQKLRLTTSPFKQRARDGIPRCFESAGLTHFSSFFTSK